MTTALSPLLRPALIKPVRPLSPRLLAGLTLAALLANPAMAQAPAAAGTATTTTTTTASTGAAEAPLGVGGSVTTSSGLVFKLMKPGQGLSPKASDTVRVHYRGSFTDGKEFDSSYGRGTPAEFPLNRVIKCWTEGVQRLQVGGSARLTCPAAIAYGERGRSGIPPNATLIFEVELLAIVTP